MGFLTDAGLSWLQQRQALERLNSTMGPPTDAQAAQQAAMQQNVDAGLLSHMGNQYMDRIGARTGLGALGFGSGQEYKPWGPAGQPVPFQAGRGVNAPPEDDGGKSKILTLFKLMFPG